MASGMIDSQGMSEVLEMVTKSAVKKMLVTPGMARRSRANESSGEVPATSVVGPPTGVPTVNFMAFGFGEGATITAIAGRG